MSDEVKTSFVADDKEMLAAYRRMQKEVEKYKKMVAEAGGAHKKAGDEAKAAADQQSKGINAAIGGLGRMAVSWISVSAAIQVATAEYQNHLEVQKDAATETISTADAQIKFFRNLGRVSAEESKKVQADIKAIAAAVNQPVKNVYTAATEAISAQGNLSRDQMLANVKMGFRMAPESVAEATAISGALGDVASLTGSGNAAENAGLMLGMGEQTRITNMQAIAKNLVPGAIGVKGSGGTTADAAALVSTLTLAMKDREGATSGTAAIQLAAQLDKYTGDGDPLDQIKKLQGDAKLRDKFLKQASFEAKAQIPIRDLLTGGSATAGLFDANRAKVPAGQAAIDQTNAFFQNLGDTPEQKAAGLERAFTAKASELDLSNIMGATSSINREGLTKVLKASGASGMAQFGANRFFDLFTMGGQNPNEVAAGLIEERADTIRGVDPGTRKGAIAADPRDEAIAKKLDAMIAELRGIRGQGKAKKNIDQHGE